jgi:hypothetical protein
MGHEDECLTLLIEIIEEAEDFLTGFALEISVLEF